MKYIALFLLLFVFNSAAQVYDAKDLEIFSKKTEYSVKNELASKAAGDIIAEIGRTFIGTDYKAHTLEIDGPEQLVVDLTGLDCTTFLETSLALARCIKKGNANFDSFKEELTLVRYRGGKIDTYLSRLHYFSDWIYDNVKKGVVKDVTKDIGGQKMRFAVDFMSTHPDSYKQLKENNSFIPAMQKFEDDINSRDYYYIPKSEVDDIEKGINNGDLIAITTGIKGLDIGHVGIAVEKEGRIHFMHAPLEGSKVQISSEPIGSYLAKIKKHTGIIILRAE